VSQVIINVSDVGADARSAFVHQLSYASDAIEGIEKSRSEIVITVSDDAVDAVRERAQALLGKLVAETREIPTTVWFESAPDADYPAEDVFPEMLARDWVVEFTPGLIGVGGPFQSLVDRFEAGMMRWAGEHDAVEYTYPDLVSIESLKRVHYLEGFPAHVVFTTRLRKNLDAIHEFASTIAHDDSCLSDTYLAQPSHTLKTAVCLHVYDHFQDRTIDLDRPLYITTKGRCKRDESVNMRTAERLLDFLMREFVFIGREDWVLKQRMDLMERAREIVEQLGLRARIVSAGDPFYSEDDALKDTEQTRDPQKYELLAYLPATDSEIAIGSFNFHGEFLAQTFNIHSQTGEPVYTGCVGFGMERCIYAFVSQVGIQGALDALGRA